MKEVSPKTLVSFVFVLAVIFVAGVVFLMIESNVRYNKAEEKRISEVIKAIKSNKPIICYNESLLYGNAGHLVLHPKIVGKDKVLSEDKVVYRIRNCEVLEGEIK